MSTWHPVAVNITINQSDSMFKVSCEAARKKKGVAGPGIEPSASWWMDWAKSVPATIQPNRHYLLCVAAHHVSNWTLKPIHRHNTWAVSYTFRVLRSQKVINSFSLSKSPESVNQIRALLWQVVFESKWFDTWFLPVFTRLLLAPVLNTFKVQVALSAALSFISSC